MGDATDFLPDEIIEIADDAPEELEIGQADLEAMEALAAYLPNGDILTDEERRVHMYVRLVNQIETEREGAKQNVRAMLHAIEMQAERRLTGLKFRYGAEVRQTVTRMIGSGKAKSIKTPFGPCGFRTVPGKLEIVNEDGLLNAMPEFRVMRFTPNRQALQAHFKRTGEIPPGCEYR